MSDKKERVIMHNTQKKQNKILLVSLVVILASAAILVAVTGSANRKNPTENPPLDNKVESEGTQDTDSPSPIIITEKVTPSTDEKDTSEKKDEESDKKTDASADKEEDEKEVSSVIDNVLPKFSSPVESVAIKDYSDNVPVFSYTMNDYRTHNGLDFAASPGTPVYSAADGVICEIKDDPMMGATIAVQHSGGAITKYKGLSLDSLDLHNIGDAVGRGDVIGSTGDTALIESAEESHLHFEMTIQGEHVDPAEYIQVSCLSNIYED